MSIKDLPKHERPREKLLAHGVDNLSDKELLAILFRTGQVGKTVIELAEEVLAKFPKKQLLQVTHDDLVKIKGLSSGKISTLLAAFELAKRSLDLQSNQLPTISSIEQVLILVHAIRNKKQEHFVALYLNARNELLHKKTIGIGTVNASLVHPRDVFAPALNHNASSLIVVHNHPSGDTAPSAEDREVTLRLIEAGKILGIEVLRHIIVTIDDYSVIKN